MSKILKPIRLKSMRVNSDAAQRIKEYIWGNKKTYKPTASVGGGGVKTQRIGVDTRGKTVELGSDGGE